MEPAEVALVVDGQAFQKVCLETGVGVRPPMQTRAPPSGAMYFCVREGVWVSLCVCARAHRTRCSGHFPLSTRWVCHRHSCKHGKALYLTNLKLFKVIQQCLPAIPTPMRLRQGDYYKSQTCLGYRVRPYLKKTTKQ